MKRFLIHFYLCVIAASISALVFAPFTFAGAMQVGNLLSQVRNSSGSLTGGHVHFYSAGTTTNKTVWTTSAKSVAAANPYTLDANGAAYLFGDGTYRIVIHTAAGTTAYDWDNLRIEDFLSGFTGDGTGNISGFDNLTLTGRMTSATSTVTTATTTTDNITTANITTLNVTGTPTFADNTINGADLIDNTVPVGKLNFTPLGYVLPVSSWNTLSIVDSQTLYWGAFGTQVSTTATNHKVYIPATGTIKKAHITVGCETEAGTGEAWPFYVRIDNTTDTLIESVAEDNVAIRTWDNTALSIAVTAGNYLEIKSVNPAWATNPIECYFGGYLYVE